jgi:hypothetical protein
MSPLPPETFIKAWLGGRGAALRRILAAREAAATA